MHILDRLPQKSSGAKAAETSKPSEPVDDGRQLLQQLGKRADDAKNSVLRPLFDSACILPIVG